MDSPPALPTLRHRAAANGTGEIETSYAYTYHSGTTQIAQRTTTWPVIPIEQNGTGAAATRKDYIDINGRPTWSMDERGYITHRIYDLGTGAIVRQIDDVDTSIVSGAPYGWTTPGDGGKNLVTDYESDDQGRTTQVLGPAHTIDIDGAAREIRRASWMVYDDVNHVTYSGNGYETQDTSEPEYVLINPVSITKMDADGKVLEQIQAVSAETEGTLALAEIIEDAGSGAAAFPQSSYSRWTTTQYIDCCLAVSQRAYHTIPSSGTGTEGTNYDQANYGYDVMKRRNRTVTPGGTIARMVFDARGMTTSMWVGTNDDGATSDDPSGNGADPGNNMVVVTSNVYDEDEPGLDGNLTEQTQHVDATTGRVTSFVYDWRNRRVDTDGEIDFFQRVIYDNLSRIVETRRYDTTSAGNLIAKSEMKYNDRGGVFRAIRYGVNPSTGDIGNHLTDNTWFDDSGNVLQSLPSGSKLFTKAVYDSLGRRIVQYLGYTPVSSSSSSSSSSSGGNLPDSVVNDVILEQSEANFDDASNAIETTFRQRYHNAPATNLGPLGDPENAPKARVAYTAKYSDPLGRPLATAEYGTNGGTALNRSDTVPTPSDDILVGLAVYDDAGNTLSTTDPSGVVTRMSYDDLGRVTERVQNYQETGSSSSSSGISDGCESSDDINVTVRRSYNADGNLATMTAINAATGNQTTTYIYGTTLLDSSIATSVLKRKEAYPDAADENDVIAIGYNRQSQVTTWTNQNGTIHRYDYDPLGRLIQDRVTVVGSQVDDEVRRIGTSYEVRGMREKLTSYDQAEVGTGNILNEVEAEYNDFGQLVTEYQSHNGAVNVTSTPTVQYDYADGSDNTIRQTLLVYPSGRQLTYSYGDTCGISDAASRIEAIIDIDDTHLVEYKYLGRGTFVVGDDTEPQVKWTLVALDAENDPETGDIYSGLDRFGRIKDNRWFNYSSEEDIDRAQYGYARFGTPLWRADPVARALGEEFDALYDYDGTHRLKNMRRGLLNNTQSALTTQTFEQCWKLDSTGNWSTMKEAEAGEAWTLEQTRTASEGNEITNIQTTIGPVSATPQYDHAGNMIVTPHPNEASTELTLTYDAWGRISQVMQGASMIVAYSYDARMFRITNTRPPTSVSSSSSSDTHISATTTSHVYYTRLWQLIESRTTDNLLPTQQHVWGRRSIDDLILRDTYVPPSATLDEREYASHDIDTSTTSLFSPAGIPLERFVYNSYGKVTRLTPSFTSNLSMSTWDILFTGRLVDDATSLIDFRIRTVHSALGVFMTRDPLKYVDGPHLYRLWFVPFGTDVFGLQAERGAPLFEGEMSVEEFQRLMFYHLYRNDQSTAGFESQISQGCLGYVNAWLGFDFNPRRGSYRYPPATRCYKKYEDALAALDNLTCCDENDQPTTDRFGRTREPTIVMMQYNNQLLTPNGPGGRTLPQANGDGSFDLGDLLPLLPSGNFDFATYTGEGNLWLHGSSAGRPAVISDRALLERQFEQNQGDYAADFKPKPGEQVYLFNEMWWCTVCPALEQ